MRPSRTSSRETYCSLEVSETARVLLGVREYNAWGAGFGLSGIPETLLAALSKRKDVKDIIAVSNNAGVGDLGLGMCVILTITSLPSSFA